MARILALSTGSTSTKFAVFDGSDCVLQTTIRHQPREVSEDLTIEEQCKKRRDAIDAALGSKAQSLAGLAAIMTIGGTLKPMPGGIYRVNRRMAEDILEGRVYMPHASNLGALVAYEIGLEFGFEAYIVDPVTTDEFGELARVSGFSQVKRLSQAHSLNAKAVARRVARATGKRFLETAFVVAHMGGGSSVCAISEGRIIDASTSRQDGPFSAQAAGGLAMPDFIDYVCENGVDLKTLKRMWFGAGGLVSLLGTSDVLQAQRMMDDGDKNAEVALKAMAYNHAKAIGAMAAVLGRNPDAIVLTGGAAYSDRIVGWIEQRVRFLGPVHVVAGEDEMTALMEAAQRVLSGVESPKCYR